MALMKADLLHLYDADALIDEAKAHAKVAAYHTAQEVLLARIARACKSAKTAQAMHENFRRFGALPTAAAAAGPVRPR